MFAVVALILIAVFASLAALGWIDVGSSSDDLVRVLGVAAILAVVAAAILFVGKTKQQPQDSKFKKPN